MNLPDFMPEICQISCKSKKIRFRALTKYRSFVYTHELYTKDQTLVIVLYVQDEGRGLHVLLCCSSHWVTIFGILASSFSAAVLPSNSTVPCNILIFTMFTCLVTLLLLHRFLKLPKLNYVQKSQYLFKIVNR